MLDRLGPRAAASHETAARLWGLELVEVGRDRVTVPRQRSRVELPGWAVRRHDLAPDAVVVVEGVRVTTPAQTVLDLAGVLPLDEAVAAADSALRQSLAGLEELAALLGTRVGRGAARPRAVLPLVDPWSGSVLESLLRVLLVRAGLPPAVSQWEVRDRDGAFVARVDLAWPGARLVVEADGFAFHSDRGAYRSDRRRLNALERLGWRVLRFSWEDVRHRPHEVVAAVQACLALAA